MLVFIILLFLRCLSRLVVIIPTLILLRSIVNLRVNRIFKNIIVPVIGCVLMVGVRLLFSVVSLNMINNFIIIIICAIVYLTVVIFIGRKDIIKINS